nr:alpha-galactosidase [Candidatus Njordarchaeota archaeon]
MAKRGHDEGEEVRLNVLKDRTLEVSNQFEIFQFDLVNGKYNVFLKEKKDVSIRNAFSRVVLSEGEIIKTSDKWTERSWQKTVGGSKENPRIGFEVTYRGATNKKLGNSSILLSVELCAKAPVILLRLEFKNNSSKPMCIKELQPLVIDSKAGSLFTLGSSIKNWRFLKNGYQTSSPCYSLSLTELDKTCSVEFFRTNYNPRSKLIPVKGEFDSEWMTAFRDNATGNCAVVGFATMKDSMCQIDFKVDKKEETVEGLWARSVLDDIICGDGRTVGSEKLLIDMLGQVSDELDRYADEVASEMNAVTWREVPTGWCSWYEFFEKISEQLILNVIEHYQKNRDKYPIEYLQVDDGYFIHRGDWTTSNERFPHGMKFVADKIKQAGFKPGLWLSPFQVSGGSKLFHEHPDWTIRDEKGNPIAEGFDASMKYSYYGLDCTNPAVIEWLKSLFKTVTRDWGYDYVKIDFLYAAAAEGMRYEKNVTRAQALRRGLEAIREAVGDNVMILGCLAPLGQGIGMVNSYRVSPDTATRWKTPWPFDCGPALQDTMRNTILRYFMHNKFWFNDPDCVIARRGKDRSEFPKAAEIEYLAQGGTISEDEVKFEFTVLGILGGVLVYSDDPIHIPPERERYLPLILPPYQGKARIIDLLEDALPKILNLKIHKDHGDWDLVGLLNWSNAPSDIQLDFSRLGLKKGQYYHVFSFWDEKYLGKIRDKLTVSKIPAHSASLLSIRETLKRPLLISSTIHITQGGPEVENATWKDKEKILEIGLTHPGRRSGKLFIYVPQPFKFSSMTPKNAEVKVNKTSAIDSLLVLEVTFKQSASISIEFE